jgi:phospholipase/carboxylesterase
MHFLHQPAQQQSEHTPTLIMLHGRGSDEHDLFGLKKYLDPRLDIYSLRAPYEFGWGGYTWFELFDDGRVDDESVHKSKNEILSFISTLNTQKLFLLGFSMGAIMSYSIALTQPNLCKGIACLSGFAPKQLEHEYKLTDLQNLHIFISHGIHDPVIPISSARRTRELLLQSNAQVLYYEYPFGHQIGEQCLADLLAWFKTVLR